MVNRLRIPELRLSEVEEVIKKGHKSFEEKVADLEQSTEDLTKQRNSASKIWREAVKDCKRAQVKANKANKRLQKQLPKLATVEPDYQ